MEKIFENMTLRDAAAALGDLAAPRFCIVCGGRLLLREKHICLKCEMDLPYTGYWNMPRNPMADRFNDRIREAGPDDGRRRYCCAAALLFYNGESPYKNIPRHIKYNYGTRAGRYFAGRLGHLLAGSEIFRSVDTVIPVPLHWTRRLRRGYNQSEVIAGCLASVLGASLDTRSLRRTRRTRTQTRVDVRHKGDNVKGAFRMAGAPQGRHILLVDDTFTTGSTLYECYRALCGVLTPEVRISVATLAYVSEWM